MLLTVPAAPRREATEPPDGATSILPSGAAPGRAVARMSGIQEPARWFFGCHGHCLGMQGQGVGGAASPGSSDPRLTAGLPVTPQGFAHLAPTPDSLCNAGQGKWHGVSPQCCPLHTCPLCHPWGWAGVGDRAPTVLRCKHESPLQEEDPNQLSHIPGEVLGITHRHTPAFLPQLCPISQRQSGEKLPLGAASTPVFVAMGWNRADPHGLSQGEHGQQEQEDGSHHQKAAAVMATKHTHP